MPAADYTPGKAIILSRLPAKDWFHAGEAARYSGWSQSFIYARIQSGDLPAQEFQKEGKIGSGPYRTFRIHVDDLVIFILKHGNGRFTEQKPFFDVVGIVRNWPRWMIRELHTALGRILSATPGNTANGTRGGTAQTGSPSGEPVDPVNH